MTTPFRFGYQAFAPDTAAQWRDMARKAEDFGYSTFHLADHYLGEGDAYTKAAHPPQSVAAVPAMVAAAAVTETIKIGCRVFCCDYHNPVVLAKEMATIDLMSDGRLEAGFGAGWITSEYEAIGIEMDRPGIRIARMAEYIEFSKQFFAGGQMDYQGTYVKASGFEALPVSPQPGGPKIMVGGGSPKVLGIAGKMADIVSINFDNSAGKIGEHGLASSTAERTHQKLDWIRDGAGDRFDDIEIEIAAYFTAVTEHTEATVAAMAQGFGMSAEEMAAHPHALIGSVDQICEGLIERREKYGISYLTVGATQLDDFAPVVAKLSGT